METARKVIPEWALEAEAKLRRFGISKVKLSRMIDINYTMMINVFSGYYKRPDIQAKILSKVAELEKAG